MSTMRTTVPKGQPYYDIYHYDVAANQWVGWDNVTYKFDILPNCSTSVCSNYPKHFRDHRAKFTAVAVDDYFTC